MSYKKYLYEENAPFIKPDYPSQEGVLEVEDFRHTTVDLGEQVDNGRFYNILVGVNTAEIINNYLKIIFSYSGGNVEAKIWGNRGVDLEEIKKELEEKRIFRVNGKWNEWPKGSGKFSMVVDSYEHDENAKASDLVPKIDESRTELKNELLYYIDQMSEPYKKLTLDILEEVWDEYSTAPAAKGNHHNKLGGLLQHTVENMRISHHFLNMTEEEIENQLDWLERFMNKIRLNQLKEYRKSNNTGKFFSPFYEKEDHSIMLFHNFLKSLNENDGKIDRDIVTFANIFHDIGKIMEYVHLGADKERYQIFFPNMKFSDGNFSVGISTDDHGIRLGHITLGMLFLHRKFIEHKITDGDFVLNVLSAISSHHGKREWGSPTAPVTPEEYLVHIADLIGSRFANEK